MVWKAVRTFRDGIDKLDAETLNTPINQLVARTEYLKRALEDAGGRTSVTIANAELSDEGGVLPDIGQPVYRVPGSNAYSAAAAFVGDVGESKWFWADSQAMAVGVVGSLRHDNKATVVLSGYVSFEDAIPVGDVIADPNPTSGRYFLAATPGKLTASPTGPIVYVCDCEIDSTAGKLLSMIVNPQYRDTGESHIHRSFVLSGRPCGYAVKVGETRYHVAGVVPSGYEKSTSAMPTNTVVAVPLGHWAYDGDVTYTLTVKDGGTKIDWASGGVDGSGTGVPISYDTPVAIGSHGFKVGFVAFGSPTLGSLDGQTWTFSMPSDGDVWLGCDESGIPVGFRLNLGMRPEMARFIPPMAPYNGAELTVDGVSLPGKEFGSGRRWEIKCADDDGGPWLVWYGGEVAGVGWTAPFVWASEIASQTQRNISLYASRMRVGPTGFVTSLQAAPGSILKVTSAQTGASAMQGALQVGLGLSFRSESGGAEGSEVVKRIEGDRFITGQVVERVVAGPGVAVDRQQGTVTISASNAMYSGDFETIALRNAKQDLAGGVFPYTKLLRWSQGSSNVDSGFTAKFRVPDSIPYNAERGYYVVVSASVFGEVGSSADLAAATFSIGSFVLPDRACTLAAESVDFTGSLATLAGADVDLYEPTVSIPLKGGYVAYDPVLVHGFGSVSGSSPGSLILPDKDNQRVFCSALWLEQSAGSRVIVHPGYFVGISIKRCGAPSGTTAYEPAIGFLSLRWNLVAI